MDKETGELNYINVKNWKQTGVATTGDYFIR